MAIAVSDGPDQWDRALAIATQLSGERGPTRALVRAMHALVVADERTDLPPPKEETKRKPVSDARTVLSPPKPARRRRVSHQPEQEVLW